MITGELCKECGHPDYDHRGGHCDWRREGAVLKCSCTCFVSPTAEAVAALPISEQEKLACANQLGIDPEGITHVQKTDNDQFTGLIVTVAIPIEGTMEDWIEENIPKEKREWITNYLSQRAVVTEQQKERF